MATLTPTNIGHPGADVVTQAAAGGGDLAPVGDHTYLLIRNGGGSDCVVTLTVVANVDGLTVPNRTFTVNASDISMIPMLGIYKNAGDGMCHIGYSQVTSVVVGAVIVPD
jgi:hypothetical protein